MFVRIEFDRVAAATDEKLDKQTIRMSEIEGLLSDHMDVSTAVQLERLDELERQMLLIELDPGPCFPLGRRDRSGQRVVRRQRQHASASSTLPLAVQPHAAVDVAQPTSQRDRYLN